MGGRKGNRMDEVVIEWTDAHLNVLYNFGIE